MMADLQTFSVVQTTCENGDLEIFAVPKCWIVDGKVFWPPGKDGSQKARKRAFPTDKWTKHSCVILRDNIGIFIITYLTHVSSNRYYFSLL